MTDILDVSINGIAVGTLSRADGTLRFSYNEGYSGPDLSVGMTYMDGAAEYSGPEVQAWFDGLLPDSPAARAAMARRGGHKATDTFRLLEEYGCDLPGAVIVAPHGAPRVEMQSEYVPIDRDQIGERLAGVLASTDTSWQGVGERWSLAGNQEKIALRLHDGRYCTCIGKAASNVIVKPGVTSLQLQALNEAVSMRLAAACGLPTADVRYERFGEVDAIVVERYDRMTDPASGNVERIHQEDLCQALGVPPARKYTSDGGPSSPDIIGALLLCASRDDALRFVDALLFNYLIAGTDAHAKNYSLLLLPGPSAIMAPLYDVASYLPYVASSRERIRIAMGIGGENEIGRLSAVNLARVARQCGVAPASVKDRFALIAATIVDKFDDVVQSFRHAPGIDELASRMRPRLIESCESSARRMETSWRKHGADIIGQAPTQVPPQMTARNGTLRGHQPGM